MLRQCRNPQGAAPTCRSRLLCVRIPHHCAPFRRTTAVPAAAVSSRPAGSVSSSSSNSSSLAAPCQVLQGTPLADAHLQAHYDSVVIGSGMSGLSTAAALAKFAGQRVLVLEQHYTAGGFTQTFRRGRYAWNVGVHYIGGGIGDPAGYAFAPFNALTGGCVSWAPLPDTYDRIIIEDRQYDFVKGREAWLEKMTSYFPRERDALKQMLQLSQSVTRSVRLRALAKVLPEPLFHLTSQWTVGPLAEMGKLTAAQAINQITQNRELQAVLCGQWMDIGLPPGRSSAVHQLTLLDHYMAGGYLPVGGSSSIVAALIKPIEATGGLVVTSADVAEVLVRGDRAVGVKLSSGDEVTADQVISTAGLDNTYSHLLPAAVREAQPRIQQQLAMATDAGPSKSTVVLYLGLQEPQIPEFEGLGNIHKHHSANQDADFDRSMKSMEAPFGQLFVACCDAREVVSTSANTVNGNGGGSSGSTGVARGFADTATKVKGSQQGFSTVQVALPASYDWFAQWRGTSWHHRGSDYEEAKQRLTDRLIAELGHLFPQLPGRIAFSELSTPLSTQHFVRSAQGCIYGLNASPSKFMANDMRGFGPRTPIRGLYLAGADSLGGGIVPVMISGLVCSTVVGGPQLALQLKKELERWSSS